MRINILLITVLLCLFSIDSFNQTLLINEFQARNSSTIKDNYDEFADWIEIANVSGQSINLNGYYLTDDFTNKFKFKFSGNLVIPVGGYIIIWADNDLSQGSNHANFKLSGDGGQIALVSPGYLIIDSVTYSKQYTDVSLGRNIINNTWKFYSSPTPGSQNSTTPFDGVSEEPVFNLSSGIYSTSQQVTISAGTSTIYYTLDNSSPSASSNLYSGPITVNTSKIIRAIALHSGWISSSIVSQSYLFNINHSTPVLDIITDSLNLFGSSGIYTNYSSDWEKLCQIKYLVDGALQVESNAGLKIQGGSSVYMSKKSFRLIFKDVFGNGEINYPFFGADYISSFKRLVLKAGYDDDITFESSQAGTLLRDALSIELWKAIGGLPQLSKFTALYLNNRYWGIYDLRESIDEHFIEAHTNYTNFDLIRMVDDSIELKYGSETNWNNWYNYVSETDFSNNENYQQVQTIMDMDQFISLMSFVQCSGYYSWCYGVSWYRENVSEGKWRPEIWDTDRSYGNCSYDDSKNLVWNGFNEIEVTSGRDHYPNIFPHQLMANAEFKKQYVNRICDLLNTTFNSDSAIAILDSIYTIVKPEIPKELARWNPSNTFWEANVEKIRDYLRRRPDTLKQQIKSYFGISNFYTLTLNAQGNGTIRVNKLKISKFPWNGTYAGDNTFEIEAIPAEGCYFAGWDTEGANPVSIKSVSLQNNISYTAIFKSWPAGISTSTTNSIKMRAFPNPFGANTNIEFQLNKALSVDISVFTVDGRLVNKIFQGKLTEGDHTIIWNGHQSDGSSSNAGLYIIQLRTPEFIEYLKIIKNVSVISR